jgi:hypothetical protein
MLVGGCHGVAGCGLGKCSRAWSKIGNLFTETARIPTSETEDSRKKHLLSPPHLTKTTATTQLSATTMPSVFSNPPGSQSSSPSRPDARRLLPESTTPLEPLVARLLAPCVVANPRKGASRRPAHAAAIPFAAEMLDAERRLVSRDFRQQLRDASIRRSRQGGIWRRCGQTAITKPLGRWRGGRRAIWWDTSWVARRQ